LQVAHTLPVAEALLNLLFEPVDLRKPTGDHGTKL
jgi:hypothetical protein